MSQAGNLPRHIAIVMDGNGRWAQKQGLPRFAGHKAGAKVFQDMARYCNKLGIGALTVYAFSTENWNRPKDEVDGLMNELRSYLKNTSAFQKENIRLVFSGDRSRLAPDLQELMEKAEKDSLSATGLVVNMAINYGGRDEILRAVRSLAKECVEGVREAADLTEGDITDRLDAPFLPALDLFIRPGGEQRISNFLLWQAAYAEFYFTDTLWPDFKEADLDLAIASFGNRERRFGGLKNTTQSKRRSV
ncbi:MAG: di-trans,poly-cis-decaprenylcistransferase [Oscillospiraceae bacterium]|nr:di-trans,poly-cis-decaprenylcistransferase [Oscillospiraceae bacterium]